MTTVRVPNCTHQERRRLSLDTIPRGWIILGAVVASWLLVVLAGHLLAAITRLAAGGVL